MFIDIKEFGRAAEQYFGEPRKIWTTIASPRVTITQRTRKTPLPRRISVRSWRSQERYWLGEIVREYWLFVASSHPAAFSCSGQCAQTQASSCGCWEAFSWVNNNTHRKSRMNEYNNKMLRMFKWLFQFLPWNRPTSLVEPFPCTTRTSMLWSSSSLTLLPMNNPKE